MQHHSEYQKNYYLAHALERTTRLHVVQLSSDIPSGMHGFKGGPMQLKTMSLLRSTVISFPDESIKTLRHIFHAFQVDC